MRNIKIMKKNKKSPHPNWAIKHRVSGTELRNFGGKFYLYAVKSEYDRKLKRARKITGQLLGRITKEEGLVESEKKKLKEKVALGFDPSKLSIKEYGFTSFINSYFNDITDQIKKFFPDHWQLIIIISYCRIVHQSCIKNMPLLYSKSFLSEQFGISLSDKRVSHFLRELGQMREAASSYMRSFIKPNDYVLFDMTNVFNSSNNIALSKEGYNSDFLFEKQFNLLYLFSPLLSQPVFYRLFPGSLREVKGFTTCLKESGLESAVIITDKGFYSEKNVGQLNQQNLNYIIPLKRNNPLIDYKGLSKQGKNYFQFNGRYIWFHKYKTDGKCICLFLDGELQQKEERDYLSRIETLPESYSIKEFHIKKEKFGTMAMISRIKKESTPEEIYFNYKSRGTIEVLFDSMKNILKNDRTYMQNEDALHGWMFINHITLQWYYKLYAILKEKKCLKKFSVGDIVLNLREVRKARMNGDWIMEPIVKQTELMLEKINCHIT